MGLIERKANVIYAAKCVGHSECEKSCPVGAIELVLGNANNKVEVPIIDENFETNVKGIFISNKKIAVIYNSNIIEIKENKIEIEVNEKVELIPNDYVLFLLEENFRLIF